MMHSEEYKMRRILSWYDCPRQFTTMDKNGQYFLVSCTEDRADESGNWVIQYIYTPVPQEFCEFVENTYSTNDFICNWMQLALAKMEGKMRLWEDVVGKNEILSSRTWEVEYTEESGKEYIGYVSENDPRYEDDPPRLEKEKVT